MPTVRAHVAAPLLARAVAATRTGGSVVSVGRLAGPGPTAEIDLFALARLRSGHAGGEVATTLT